MIKQSILQFLLVGHCDTYFTFSICPELGCDRRPTIKNIYIEILFLTLYNSNARPWNAKILYVNTGLKKQRIKYRNIIVASVHPFNALFVVYFINT